MIRETETMTFHVANLAASASDELQFYFPWPARIVRYAAVPSVDEAAHATQVLDVTFTNKGSDGTGTDTLAVLTNDSDLADNTTGPARKSSAWAANEVKEIKTNSRPDSPTNAENVQDEIAAGEVVEAVVAKGSGTTTGDVMVMVEYQRGD